MFLLLSKIIFIRNNAIKKSCMCSSFCTVFFLIKEIIKQKKLRQSEERVCNLILTHPNRTVYIRPNRADITIAIHTINRTPRLVMLKDGFRLFVKLSQASN